MTKYYLNPKNGTLIGFNEVGEVFEIDTEAREIIKLDELNSKQVSCSAVVALVTKRKYTRREKASDDDQEDDEETGTEAKKLYKPTIAKIKQLKAGGYTSGQIAEKLGLSLASVNQYYA